MYLVAGIGRKGLAPAGGVVTVTALAWTGERSVAHVSSRMLNKSAQRMARSFQQQQRYQFTSKASDSTKAEATKKSGSFVDWYEGHLQARPVVTKMGTGCILWGIGDAVAQLVPQMSETKAEGNESKPFEYDMARTGRACLFGFALHAPTSHLHFNFLEWLTNRVGVTGLGIPIFKTFMEQFVYWGWVSNAMYLSAMGAMQGHSSTDIYNKIHDNLWDLMKAQWAFWLPVQALNFQFVPVRHQLNVVLVVSIVWTALLSFWYPPQPKSSEKALEDEAPKS